MCRLSTGDAATREANDDAVTAPRWRHSAGWTHLVNCVGVFDFYRGLSEIAADDLT